MKAKKTTATEATDNIVTETSATSTNLPTCPFTTEWLTGKLYWDGPRVEKQFIVVELDGEEPGSDGTTPRRGITLNLDATETFVALFDRSLFLGDKVSIGVRVMRGSTIEADLNAGIGIRGNDELIGMSIAFA